MNVGSDETYGERIKLSNTPHRTEKSENGREGVRMTKLVSQSRNQFWLAIKIQELATTEMRGRSRSSAREKDTTLSQNYSKDD